MKNYLNLTVHISSRPGGEYRVRVTSEQGQGISTFKLEDVAGPRFAGVRGARDLGSQTPDPEHQPGLSTSQYGEKLYEALFKGDARDVLVNTEQEARRTPGFGVRIRLTIDLSEDGIAEVASLPWELMRRRGEQPLVVSTQTVLVRAIDIPQPIAPRATSRPLRILVIRSNPPDSGSLNLQGETDALAQLWAELEGVEVDYVRPVPAMIRRQLAAADYHVIHYMGHGDFEADEGGMLLLEHADGRAQPVGAGAIVSWLQDEPLRLVFLNACQTGATARHAGPHPFAGVATALIGAGVPAVVAMQFPISDDAAIEFARTFYERISQGFPVEAAVAEGRKALFGPEPGEWATPVLYLRAKDGNLFEQPDAGPPTALDPPPVEAAPASVSALAASPAPGAERRSDGPRAGLPRQAKLFMAIGGAVVAVILAIVVLGPRFSAEEAAPETDVAAAAAEGTATPPGKAEDAIAAVPAADWVNENANERISSKVLEATTRQAIEQLAEGGDAKAQYVMSDIAYDEDSKKMFAWTKQAADQGLPIAEYWTGVYFQQGRGTQQDDALMADYWRRAAEHGSNDARQKLKETCEAGVALAC